MARLATLTLFALLVCFQLYKVFHTPVWIDAALFANAAKNLAFGRGYAEVFYNKLFPFSPGITAGPVIILPAALMIKLLGNAFWVPGLANVVLIGLLLTLAFYQLRQVITNPSLHWQAAFLFLFVVMVVTNTDIDNHSEMMLEWHALLGEIPSALFVIIAILYAAQDRKNAQRLFAGGAIAGLGVLCKLQALMGAGTVAVCLLGGDLPWRERVSKAVIYSLGLAVPLAAFEGIKILYFDDYHAYLQTVLGLSSGLERFNATLPTAYIIRKFYEFGALAGITHPGLLVPVVLMFAALIIYCKRMCSLYLASGTRAPGWASAVLLSASIFHLLWWLLICSFTTPRYALQGLCYGVAALALVNAHYTSLHPVKGKFVALLLIAFLCCARYDAVAYPFIGMRESPALQDEKHALKILESLQKETPGLTIYSCGNAFEMESLLPGSGNFTPCDELASGRGHYPAVLLSAFTNYTNEMPNVRGSDGNAFIYRKIWRGNLPAARAHCPKDDIYRGEHYFIATCHRD